MSTTTRTRSSVCQDWNNRIQAERRELNRLQRELDGNVAHLEELEQALHTGRGHDDRWHVRKDGSRFWCSGVLTPLKDVDGALRGFAKVMRDQTERKMHDAAGLVTGELQARHHIDCVTHRRLRSGERDR